MDAHSQVAPFPDAPPDNALIEPPPSCSLCTRPLHPHDSPTVVICGDCKFLLLEDLDSHPRHSTARHDQSAPSPDADASSRFAPRSSSHTTPTGSTRWRRFLSDSDTDGFDHIDSFFADTEPNLGSSRYRFSLADADATSLSAFGAESDASIDGNSIFDAEMLIQPADDASLYSDPDSIDPMHAGLSQWSSDDQEEHEDGEWEEADNDEGASDSMEASVQLHLQNFMISIPHGPDFPADTRPRLFSSGLERLTYWRFRRRQTHGRPVFVDADGSDIPQYVGNPGNYLDAGGFDELLEHLAETENSRRGAPPAAASFVKTLPRLIITENHERPDGLACAICKDTFATGTEVNQLPCHHLYHHSCILPWLRSRNSCPLCRYELPTDDKDYEATKRNSNNGIRIPANEDGSSYASDGADVDEAREVDLAVDELPATDAGPDISSPDTERNGRRWIFLAAPIVGLVGVVLAFWLGHPTGSCPTRLCGFAAGAPNQIGITQSSPANQRANRGRRWWSLF